MRLNPGEFANKVVVITGGAQGIGACIAHKFVEAGAHVIFTDIDVVAGRQREAALNAVSVGSVVRFVHVDMSDAAQVQQFAAELLHEFPLISLLVNNAGIFSSTSLLKRPITEWDQIIDTNLRSTYLCSQLFAESLTTTAGNIVNIASTRALMSEANTEPYAASKGGVVALTHSLSVTLGKFGIRVNCISPGWIDTSAWHLPPKASTLRDIDHQQHPAGRVGTPEDIANACCFLASDVLAGFITGHNLVVDGGMTKKMIYVD